IMDPLWRIIGLGNAKEVALTGRISDAQEALRMGYVTEVFPEGKLIESVMAIAIEMATHDRMCLKETKQLANRISNGDVDGAMRVQEGPSLTYLGAEGNHQGIDAVQAWLAAGRKNKSATQGSPGSRGAGSDVEAGAARRHAGGAR